jgi:hypothetical protein
MRRGSGGEEVVPGEALLNGEANNLAGVRKEKIAGSMWGHGVRRERGALPWDGTGETDTRVESTLEDESGTQVGDK